MAKRKKKIKQSDTITIQNTKIKIAHLFILESEFNKRLVNKPLKLEYLPASKYMISLEDDK
jgi:hypothetical protein